MELESLETDRLLLKMINPEQFSLLFREYPKAEIMSLLGLSSKEEFVEEKMKSDKGYQTYDRTILSFFLILKETNETIGRSGFHNWYLKHKRAEVGYVLYQDHHRQKGYMGEALEAIIEYGFKVMGLNQMEACISPDNMASLALVKKFGFSQEGYLRQHYIREGEILDSVIFSLLREEYSGAKTLPPPNIA